jgi:hypothetical protein
LKTDFDGDFVEFKVLKKNFSSNVGFTMLSAPQGMNDKKKKLIVDRLLPLMDQNRRGFWQQLPECNTSADLHTFQNF